MRSAGLMAAERVSGVPLCPNRDFLGNKTADS